MRRWLANLVGLDVMAGELTAMTRRAVLAEQTVERLTAVNRLLLEPDQVEGCKKIRLRDREEAEMFARRVERDSGAAVGTLEPYRCKTCPRHPLKSSRFWHVRHVERSKRGKGAAQYARSRPRELGRVNPAQLAAVLKRLGAGS